MWNPAVSASDKSMIIFNPVRGESWGCTPVSMALQKAGFLEPVHERL
jgi:hypothetical protein